MSDVMLHEASLWIDAPPLRKRKLEAPSSPPIEYCPTAIISDSDSDDENTLVEKKKYEKQLLLTGIFEFCKGFDLEDISLQYGNMFLGGCDPFTDLMGKVGLHCYNLDKGTDLQFRALKKVNGEANSFCTYYITLEAINPLDNSLVTFQTCVWDSSLKDDERLRLVTRNCRIKPQVPGTGEGIVCLWDSEAVDEFYKNDMGDWVENNALTGSDKLQYYEVKESDLRDNKWLYLYAEAALFSELGTGIIDLSAYLPLEIDRVVVRTKEDVESSLKLKSNNAIFYINFKTGGGHECKGTIRQTRDGRPKHMCLQAKCWIGKVD